MAQQPAGPKKRGRPSRAVLAAREAAKAAAEAKANRPDSEVLQELKDRFEALRALTETCAKGDLPSLIASGSTGVGKSHDVIGTLDRLGTPYVQVTGEVSSIGLYKLGYLMRQKGSVILLDDADTVFADEGGINVLKGLCDSSLERRISWMKESQYLKASGDDTEDTPKSYIFEGAIIILSNINFQAIIDEDRHRIAPHIEAVRGRSLYLDLKLHERRTLGLWVMHIANEGKMFAKAGLDKAQAAMATRFLQNNLDSVRDLQLRTVTKLAGLIKGHPDAWEKYARLTLLREQI
jgi:hypothetical protein